MERVKLIIVIAAVLISRRAHADGALCIQANATNLALMCGGTTAATAESTYNSLLNDSAVATCDQGAASASVSIDGCGNSVNAVETVLGKGYDQFVCAVKGDTNIVNFTASGNNSAIVNVTGSANHVTGAQAGANDANISINGGLAAVAISQGGGGSVNLTSSGNKNLATVTQLSGATAANLSFAGDNGQVTLLQKVESQATVKVVGGPGDPNKLTVAQDGIGAANLDVSGAGTKIIVGQSGSNSLAALTQGAHITATFSQTSGPVGANGVTASISGDSPTVTANQGPGKNNANIEINGVDHGTYVVNESGGATGAGANELSGFFAGKFQTVNISMSSSSPDPNSSSIALTGNSAKLALAVNGAMNVANVDVNADNTTTKVNVSGATNNVSVLANQNANWVVSVSGDGNYAAIVGNPTSHLVNLSQQVYMSGPNGTASVVVGEGGDRYSGFLDAPEKSATAFVANFTTPTSLLAKFAGFVFVGEQASSGAAQYALQRSGGSTVFAGQQASPGSSETTAEECIAAGDYRFVLAASQSAVVVGDLTFTACFNDCWPAPPGGFRPPLGPGPAAFKRGSTIPVKIGLLACSEIAMVHPRVYLAPVSGGVEGAKIEATSTSAADTGNFMRPGGGPQDFIYNLATNSLSPGRWILSVDLGDGLFHSQVITIKP